MAEPLQQSEWLDRPTLITGATGLLGSWLTEALEALGASVVCLVRDSVPRSRFSAEGLSDRVTIVRGDVGDQALMERILAEYEIEVVFHLAAQTIVTIANRSPISTFESNIAGTWRLLEAVRSSETVEAVVVASSDKAYGDQDVLPYREDTPLQGSHPYDVSKSCADLIAQSYAHTWGVPVVVTRCGNFFGGGDLNFNRIIPGTIRDVLRGRQPVIRSDGSYVRDYIYVEDGASAYLRTAEAILAGKALSSRAYNFSLGEPLSVSDLVAQILAIMGTTLEPIVQDGVTNEIQAQYLDADLARRELGWSPQVGLEEGLRRTVAWYSDWLDGVV